MSCPPAAPFPQPSWIQLDTTKLDSARLMDVSLFGWDLSYLGFWSRIYPYATPVLRFCRLLFRFAPFPPAKPSSEIAQANKHIHFSKRPLVVWTQPTSRTIGHWHSPTQTHMLTYIDRQIDTSGRRIYVLSLHCHNCHNFLNFHTPAFRCGINLKKSFCQPFTEPCQSQKPKCCRWWRWNLNIMQMLFDIIEEFAQCKQCGRDWSIRSVAMFEWVCPKRICWNLFQFLWHVVFTQCVW